MKKTILFAVLAAILITTPVLAAVFQANLTVVESDGNTYTNIGVTSPMNVDWMATNGYMAATGRDTRVVLGSNTYAHMLREGYINFAVPVNADSTVTYEMTTDNSLADMSIVPGYGGYVTITDAAALELGNNFEIEIDDGTTTNTGTFIDTSAGASKNLVHKFSAFRLYVSAASTLTADIINTTWVQPTGHVDPSGTWNNEANAYDGNIGTRADTVVGVGDWSNFLELSHAAITCGSMRYYIDGGGSGVDEIDVDIFYDAAWHDVYEGASTSTAYTTIYFDDYYSITSMRIRIHHIDVGGTAYLYEADYGQVSLTTVTENPVTSGEYDIAVTADTVNLKLFIDGVEVDSIALAGATVPDNTNDWVLIDNDTTDFMPYIKVYQHTVGGVLIAHYAPAAIIAGTVLPDREGVAQNGAFTFGSNPAGVLIDVGALTLVDIESPEGSSLVSPDYGDEVNVSPDMTASDNELLMPNNEFYGFILAIATLANMDVNMLWWWLASTLSIIAVAVGRKFTNNVWVAGLLGAAFSGFFVAMGGVELWIPAYIFIATAFVGVWQRTSDV